MDKIISLANEILRFAKRSLSGEFIYLAYPLGKLDAITDEGVKAVQTNGRSCYFNPEFVVRKTADIGIEAVKIMMLHTLLHCLFLHPFKKSENAELSDLAYDITVGYILDGLGYANSEKSEARQRKSVYKLINDRFGGINDKFCHDFCSELKQTEIKEYSSIFKVCDHSLWVGREAPCNKDDSEEEVSVAMPSLSDGEAEEAERAWQSISQGIIPQIGKLNLELKRVLRVAVGNEGDYKQFLRAFLRKRERIRANDEEFDYISYVYGLKEYGNMPLIENLEYSERRNVSDLAVAIDTSGSTDGEPIKRLLKEVFTLVKSVETGNERFRLRIIQCDLRIHKEDIVTTFDELDRLMQNYELIGGGGTDFRPVFEYLTSLKRKGEKIDGLIYFTDGVGVYPKDIPPYKTCFAVLGEEEPIGFPHFAYKINIEV